MINNNTATNGNIWKITFNAFNSDDYSASYKRVIEELGEFMGYMLIMFGSLEALLQRRGT
ncbi:hypothetical protein SMSP2_01211 [Limihaloglobus sulfuriphilus]|uniref:Uncharacterized protein n=1 Tax=Limihaloglobus sulfuriphilus TaxID=1851148 RepID=A0A1Q2MDX4_9BACT|nr:hypothetical protein [Limihaloglobus sulfuriphilus]AQQ70849.1 hypothetical protein SMSP2_01211 [Limihaloglobus sulfuriphilus]